MSGRKNWEVQRQAGAPGGCDAGLTPTEGGRRKGGSVPSEEVSARPVPGNACDKVACWSDLETGIE